MRLSIRPIPYASLIIRPGKEAQLFRWNYILCNGHGPDTDIGIRTSRILILFFEHSSQCAGLSSFPFSVMAGMDWDYQRFPTRKSP